jgi:hypothetical protein
MPPGSQVGGFPSQHSWPTAPHSGSGSTHVPFLHSRPRSQFPLQHGSLSPPHPGTSSHRRAFPGPVTSHDSMPAQQSCWPSHGCPRLRQVPDAASTVASPPSSATRTAPVRAAMVLAANPRITLTRVSRVVLNRLTSSSNRSPSMSLLCPSTKYGCGATAVGLRVGVCAPHLALAHARLRRACPRTRIVDPGCTQINTPNGATFRT